jgi:carbon storage regulator
MLVLSRRPGEKILLPSIPAVLQVVSVRAGVVRLGIEAPDHVPVVRHELSKAPAAAAAPAAALPRQDVSDRLNNLARGLARLREQLGGLDARARQTLDRLDDELHGLLGCPPAAGAGAGAGVPCPAGESPAAVGAPA